jgi:hypothetical protein
VVCTERRSGVVACTIFLFLCNGIFIFKKTGHAPFVYAAAEKRMHVSGAQGTLRTKLMLQQFESQTPVLYEPYDNSNT